MLGSFWDHCWIMFGYVWIIWELFLNHFRNHFWTNFVSMLDHLGLFFDMVWPCWDHFGIIFGHWDSISETLGSEGVKHKLGTLCWLPLWSHFGDLLAHLFFVRASVLRLFRYFLGVLKKLAKMTPKKVCPESLGRVPVSTGAQFSFLEPNRNRAPKRMPKWSFGGAKVLTILLFRRPVDSFWGPPFEVLFGPCPETRAVPMEELGLRLRLPGPLPPLI